MVGLVIATHGKLGEELLKAVEGCLGRQPQAAAVGIFPGEGKEDLRRKMEQALAQVDAPEGVLLLTDIFGGSPFQAAVALAEGRKALVLCGANLPMLVDLFSGRPGRDLAALGERAERAGQQGIRRVSGA
jgi:PTS system mannose-specific IIA component